MIRRRRRPALIRTASAAVAAAAAISAPSLAMRGFASLSGRDAPAASPPPPDAAGTSPTRRALGGGGGGGGGGGPSGVGPPGAGGDGDGEGEGAGGVDDDDDGCSAPPSGRPLPPRPYSVSLPLLSLACLYAFLALAIACDDCFVPSLEVLSAHFRLSDDVAGATLMAAGGSAPELFTALVGTYQREGADGIAVGTVLGSAVFNVLFVIGACAFSVPSGIDLRLSPYPLLRDCICYALGLGAFAAFTGVTSPGVVEPWEAGVMFGLYCCYVAFMAYGTGSVEVWYGGTFGGGGGGEKSAVAIAAEEEDGADDAGARGDGVAATADADVDVVDGSGMIYVGGVGGKKNLARRVMGGRSGDGGRGEYVELTSRASVAEEAGAGDPECPRTSSSDDTADTAFVSAGAFTIDDGDGDVDVDVDEEGGGGGGEDSFDNDPERPDLPEQPAGQASNESDGDDDDDYGGPLLSRLHRPPAGSSLFDYVSYVVQFPLVALLGFTIPDVRPACIPRNDEESDPERQGSSEETTADATASSSALDGGGGPHVRRAYAAFLLSIVWIGTFTYGMVRCAELIGSALSVPNVVMGLTVLATGASVPDMLSSVCVARRGKGDMAVSSTIGSNIFDLLLGLPVPWLMSFATPGYPDSASVGTDGMVVSVLVLVGMLLATVAVMRFLDWRMGAELGVAMFVMWFVFIAQAIWREMPFDSCR